MPAKKTKNITPEQFQKALREIEESHPGRKATYRELHEKLSCSNSTIKKLMETVKASHGLINSYPVEQTEQACKVFTANLTSMIANVCQNIEEKANTRILESEKIWHESISKCNQQISENQQVISKQKLDIRTLSKQVSEYQMMYQKIEVMEKQISELLEANTRMEQLMTGILRTVKDTGCTSGSKDSNQVAG